MCGLLGRAVASTMPGVTRLLCVYDGGYFETFGLSREQFDSAELSFPVRVRYLGSAFAGYLDRSAAVVVASFDSLTRYVRVLSFLPLSWVGGQKGGSVLRTRVLCAEGECLFVCLFECPFVSNAVQALVLREVSTIQRTCHGHRYAHAYYSLETAVVFSLSWLSLFVRLLIAH